MATDDLDTIARNYDKWVSEGDRVVIEATASHEAPEWQLLKLKHARAQTPRLTTRKAYVQAGARGRVSRFRPNEKMLLESGELVKYSSIYIEWEGGGTGWYPVFRGGLLEDVFLKFVEKIPPPDPNQGKLPYKR